MKILSELRTAFIDFIVNCERHFPKKFKPSNSVAFLYCFLWHRLVVFAGKKTIGCSYYNRKSKFTIFGVGLCVQKKIVRRFVDKSNGTQTKHMLVFNRFISLQ